MFGGGNRPLDKYVTVSEANTCLATHFFRSLVFTFEVKLRSYFILYFLNLLFKKKIIYFIQRKRLVFFYGATFV